MKKSKKDIEKNTRIKEWCLVNVTALCCAILTRIISNSFIYTDDTLIQEEPIKVESINELSSSDLEELILNSSKLSTDEKDILCNKEFIEDVLDVVNEDKERRSEIYQLYSNLDVEYEEIDEEGLQGYVYRKESTIHLKKEYENNKEEMKSVLAHEFIHVNQNSYKNLLTEASAEIISGEYYECEEDSYEYEVKLTKMLMEIIGPEPIIQYIYFNDKSFIQNSVKPYLSNSDYDLFDKYIFNTYTEFEIPLNRTIYYKVIDLFSKLHNNIYGENMINNPILNAQLNGSEYERYYFNERFMDEQHSCYYDIEEFDMPIEDALDCGYFYEKEMKIVKTGESVNENTPTKIFYFPTNPKSYQKGEVAHVVDLIPQPVEPINKVFIKKLKKSN